jgi:hypothetical protein
VDELRLASPVPNLHSTFRTLRPDDIRLRQEIMVFSGLQLYLTAGRLVKEGVSRCESLFTPTLDHFARSRPD